MPMARNREIDFSPLLMMNLAIDIGNSRTKLGFFVGDDLVEKRTLEHWTPKEIIELATNQAVENVILSNVANRVSTQLVQYLATNYFFIELNENTALPIANNYQTPQTLGKDRLAAVVGAYQLYPKTNCLVVDAGTCITFDVLTADGIYLGGNIAPGINMRLEAMHQFTANLPKVEKKTSKYWLGRTTEEALVNGGIMGVSLELEGMIRLCREKLGEINVILTGGDAEFLAKTLKSKIFVNQNLVLIGLNKILVHNVD